MEIIRKHNRYFLQFESGELELSEQQVQKRLERGDTVLDQLRTLEKNLPEIESNVSMEPGRIANDDIFLGQSYNSAKYFDYVMSEFEHIYKANKEIPDTIEKLKRFCRNSISKLENDRKSPKTDHVIIDFYILSWNRVINHLDTLPLKVYSEETNAHPADDGLGANGQEKSDPQSLTRQVLILQLMQADGLFPINDALEGVTQQDIERLIAGILGVQGNVTHDALHKASDILLKRNITPESLKERILILEHIETYFEELPYPNIISRIKLLLKLYRDKQAAL
ncbi:MAG TPA: hypothetical protein VL098_02210 [Flavipsychrobacter sp.]|nr:hypothetical protein [Flavipsychrobacter sp.]